ncbi:MAG: peptidoglycan DD-metalloendopeptidase family protein [Thermoleophilaceae bacterium]
MKRLLFLIPVTLATAAYIVLPLPGSSAPLGERIEQKREQVQGQRAREGVLTETIAGYNNRISGLQGQIGGLESRLARVQRNLDLKRAELFAVRDKLEVARDRLEQLRAELAEAEDALATRLAELYKEDRPDVLTVVLEADGFGDLLERTEFLDRVSDQDAEVINRVRVLKAEAKRRADELATLERRAQEAADAIQAQRDDIAAARDELARSRDQLASQRSGRRAARAKIARYREGLEENLRGLEREQAEVQQRLSGLPAGPAQRGSGALIIPTNGTFTSPFGSRWGRLHAGVDIAAPTGTAIRAAAAGRVVMAGMSGGYGNYTCIQHGGALSTCYGHQSRIGVSSGQSVSSGQVIGAVGNTGNSTGPHLHFETRINGSPVDPMGYL